jgi:hypothetical protein
MEPDLRHWINSTRFRPIYQRNCAEDGWIVVTWLDRPTTSQTNQAQYRILNADGTAFTSEVIINSSQEKPGEKPNVAALSNGHFMITYDDRRSDSRYLSLKKYDVFGGLVESSGVDDGDNPFGTVISSFSDGSFNITYNYDVNGSKYYHHASPSGSDTNHYGEADGDYHFDLFGKGTVSVDQTSYAVLYNKSTDDPGNDLYINIRSKNGDSIAKKFVTTTPEGGSSKYSDVTALSNGNYVVTYVE